MNRYKLYMKLYRLIFIWGRVFSQSDGQGLLQGWNSLLVRPEPLPIKDIKVQVNKQKPNSVGPAQMKHNSDKMTIAPMSSQPCSKPDVVGRAIHWRMALNQRCFWLRKVFSSTSVNGTTLDFNYEIITKRKDSVINNFIENSIRLLKTIQINNGV